MLVMMVTLALLILAMQRPTNVSALDQNALITISALSTNAVTEFAITLKRRAAVTEMHVPLILAAQLLDVNTLSSTVTTTTFAPPILAIP
jgi:hypothetical protein